MNATLGRRRVFGALTLLLVACGPSIEPALSLELDGSTVNYAPETSGGDALGLSFSAEALEAFTQEWTTSEVDGARGSVRMTYGSYQEAVVPVAAIGNDVVRFYDGDDAEIGAADFRVDQLIPTGNPEQPVLYAGPFSGSANGTVSFGPWCGDDDHHSNTGCGFPVPEGTDEADIAWPGLELSADTDGCSSAAWSAQLAAGDWTWSGDTLTLANGQPFDCVLTPKNELVCTGTWTHESAYGNLWYSEASCPFEVNAVIWPDVAGTASVPHQSHAYWHVKAGERLAFDIADQCLAAEAACIAYR